MKLRARCAYPENGSRSDQKICSILDPELAYEVSSVSMGLYRTEIYLHGFEKGFNSVNFVIFNEDGQVHDIFTDPKLNPYISESSTASHIRSENTPHPHAKAMLEYAKDAALSETPWENWQVGSNNKWRFLDSHPSWNKDLKYRRFDDILFEILSPYKNNLTKNDMMEIYNLITKFNGK